MRPHRVFLPAPVTAGFPAANEGAAEPEQPGNGVWGQENTDGHQIRTILDQTEPEQLSPLFNTTLMKTADEAGQWKGTGYWTAEC